MVEEETKETRRSLAKSTSDNVLPTLTQKVVKEQ